MVKLNILVVGGGMISQELILPTVFQQRRAGKIDKILIATRRAKTINTIRQAFANEEFDAWPDPNNVDPQASYPEIYKDAIEALPAPAAVIVATPDHLHTPVILDAVNAGFDSIVEKPLCLKVTEAHEIAQAAERAARYVYTDFHKRHDNALRACRYKYRRGLMGQSLCSYAWIEERREMPLKYLALWAEQSSSFEYIGCHYVDMFHFITGELPRKVVAFGQRKFLPKHGKDTYDAVQAIIEWDSGAVQYVQTSWVLPEANPNLTNQGFQITCTEGEFRADNADRNSNFVTTQGGVERFNPYFFKPYLDWDDPDRDCWLGYGGQSIIQPIDDIIRIHQETADLSAADSLAERRRIIEQFKQTRPLPNQALIATAVNEAVKLSLASDNRAVTFDKQFYPQLI